MNRYATIDVGSNSVLIHIAERGSEGNWRVLVDRAEIPRLGEGLQASDKLQPRAMERTAKVLSNFMNLVKQYKVDEVAAVGTMPLRVAKNSADFIKKVKEECGLTIEVINGEQEARLSYLAVKSGIGLKRGRMVIFDIGGGSTEFIFGIGDKIQRSFSLNIGAIQVTNQYLTSNPVTPEELNKARIMFARELVDLQSAKKVNTVVGVGGTVTSMASVRYQLEKYDSDIIQGAIIERAEIERQIELYRSKTIEERKSIVGLHPKRADIILAGTAIVEVIMQQLKIDRFVVSDHGLRHGLMISRFGN